MKEISIASLAVALFSFNSFLAQAQGPQEWVDIKDPNELRALHSDKTFRGTGWVAHYRTDGRGILIMQGSKPMQRNWVVKGNDQVCTTSEDGATRCATFKHISKERKQLMVTSIVSGMSFIFTVENGVPQF
jgi:hypothetical protein